MVRPVGPMGPGGGVSTPPLAVRARMRRRSEVPLVSSLVLGSVLGSCICYLLHRCVVRAGSAGLSVDLEHHPRNLQRAVAKSWKCVRMCGFRSEIWGGGTNGCRTVGRYGCGIWAQRGPKKGPRV